MKKIFYVFSVIVSTLMFGATFTSCDDDDDEPKEVYSWGFKLAMVSDQINESSVLRNWLVEHVDELNGKYSGKSTKESDAYAVKEDALEAFDQLLDEYHTYLDTYDVVSDWGAQYDVSFAIQTEDENLLFLHEERFSMSASAVRLSKKSAIVVAVADKFGAGDEYSTSVTFPVSEAGFNGDPFDTMTFSVARSRVYEKATTKKFDGPDFLSEAVYDPATKEITLTMKFSKESAAKYKGSHYIVLPSVVKAGTTEIKYELLVDVEIDL